MGDGNDKLDSSQPKMSPSVRDQASSTTIYFYKIIIIIIVSVDYLFLTKGMKGNIELTFYRQENE